FREWKRSSRSAEFRPRGTPLATYGDFRFTVILDAKGPAACVIAGARFSMVVSIQESRGFIAFIPPRTRAPQFCVAVGKPSRILRLSTFRALLTLLSFSPFFRARAGAKGALARVLPPITINGTRYRVLYRR